MLPLIVLPLGLSQAREVSWRLEHVETRTYDRHILLTVFADAEVTDLHVHKMRNKDPESPYHRWVKSRNNYRRITIIDLLMGRFRGAVFRHGRGARKQPIKHPTEMPTSTMALMGRFTSLIGCFPTLMGRFPDFVLRGRFTS